MWFLVSGFSILLAYFADKSFYSNKKLCKIFLTIFVIVNVIIFGLRDVGVGNDTEVYIADYVSKALHISHFKDFYYDSGVYDKGFLALALLSTSFVEDPRGLMFCTELFIMLFLAIGIYEYKKTFNYNIAIFVLAFCTLYQQESVNLMRQFCAMSLLFYGYSVFLQKKYIPYVICQILAYFFHSSSILFVIVPLFSILSHTNGRLKYYVFFGVCIFIALFIFSLFTMLMYIYDLGFLKEVYLDRYGHNLVYKGADRARLYAYFTFIIEVLLFVLMNKYKTMSSNFLYIFIALACTNFMLELTCMTSRFFSRLAYYIGIVFIVYFANVIKLKNSSIKILCSICIVLFLTKMIKDVYLKELYNQDNKLDYSSQILGIE